MIEGPKNEKVKHPPKTTPAINIARKRIGLHRQPPIYLPSISDNGRNRRVTTESNRNTSGRIE